MIQSLIDDAVELFGDMKPAEIIKEIGTVAVCFAIMGALVFLSTII